MIQLSGFFALALSAAPSTADAQPSDFKELTAEEPTAEEPTAEEPSAEEPSAEEPTAEEPTAEEPSPGETRIAIMGLTAPGFDEDIVENLYGILVAEIDSVPGYRVVARDEIEALLGLEKQKQLLGCDDTSCLAEMAGALGVDKMITGKVGKVGTTFIVNLTMVDQRTAAVDGRVVKTLKGEEDLLIEAIAAIGRELIGADRPQPEAVADVTPPAIEEKEAGFPVLPAVILAAGGVGILVGSGILGISALRYRDYQNSESREDARALQEEIPLWWIGSGVAGGVGAAAAVAGGLLLALGGE